MKKGGKYVAKDGLEYFMMPFVDLFITQGANGAYSHKGIQAIDVRGKQPGVRYAYYAPCTCKCVRTIPSYGEAFWISTKKVHFPNGRVDYAFFTTCHDDTFNAKVGMVVPQGVQLGSMGTKGFATGVHCHFEVGQSSDTSFYKNKYGVYTLNHEYAPADTYFIDDTNVLNGMGYKFKKISQAPAPAPVSKKNYVNLPPTVDSWRVYRLNSKPLKVNAVGKLNPKRFGGLSYYVYAYRDNGATAEIQTSYYGRVKIYIKNTPATITVGSYKYQNGSH